jgi:hypothetical protein
MRFLFIFLLIINLCSCKETKDYNNNTYKNETFKDDERYKRSGLERMSGDEISNLEETAYMMHRTEDKKAAKHVMTTPQGDSPTLWSLAQIKLFMENHNIGNYTELYYTLKGYKVKKGTREHDGSGEAGASIFKNNYDYIKAKYELIIENWDVLRENIPGIHLNSEEAEKVIEFAFCTSEEFYNKYPESLSGSPVE